MRIIKARRFFLFNGKMSNSYLRLNSNNYTQTNVYLKRSVNQDQNDWKYD